MSTKTERRLSKAADYIKRHEYKKARKLLNEIDHPTAREWLVKLDQIVPVKKNRNWVVTCGVLLVVCIGFTAIASILTQAGVLPDARATHDAETKVKEAARSTDRFQRDLTATIIALTPSNTPTATYTPSNTPLPSNTPRPTATRTMQEEVEGLIKNTDDTGLRDSDVESVTVNANSIYLRYRLKEAVLSTGELREQADEDYKLIACHLHDRGYQQTFAMTALAEGTDAFGNKVWLEAVEITVSPSNVSRFNCDDVNSINLSVIASQYYVHPSIDD